MSKEAQRVYLTNIMNAKIKDFGMPIALPGQPFNIPKNAPYAEFHILAGPRSLIVGGQGRGKVLVRYVGFVQLTIWLPKDKGSKAATTAEDRFKALFQFRRGRDAEESNYRFGVVQDFTPQTKAGWECVVIRVPFQRDSVEIAHIGPHS